MHFIIPCVKIFVGGFWWKKFYLEDSNNADIQDIIISDEGLFIYYGDLYIENFNGYSKEVLNILLGEM